MLIPDVLHYFHLIPCEEYVAAFTKEHFQTYIL